jgi:hypothetical protein
MPDAPSRRGLDQSARCEREHDHNEGARRRRPSTIEPPPGAREIVGPRGRDAVFRGYAPKARSKPRPGRLTSASAMGGHPHAPRGAHHAPRAAIFDLDPSNRHPASCLARPTALLLWPFPQAERSAQSAETSPGPAWHCGGAERLSASRSFVAHFRHGSRAECPPSMRGRNSSLASTRSRDARPDVRCHGPDSYATWCRARRPMATLYQPQAHSRHATPADYPRALRAPRPPSLHDMPHPGDPRPATDRLSAMLRGGPAGDRPGAGPGEGLERAEAQEPDRGDPSRPSSAPGHFHLRAQFLLVAAATTTELKGVDERSAPRQPRAVPFPPELSATSATKT